MFKGEKQRKTTPSDKSFRDHSRDVDGKANERWRVWRSAHELWTRSCCPSAFLFRPCRPLKRTTRRRRQKLRGLALESILPTRLLRLWQTESQALMCRRQWRERERRQSRRPPSPLFLFILLLVARCTNESESKFNPLVSLYVPSLLYAPFFSLFLSESVNVSHLGWRKLFYFVNKGVVFFVA